MAKFSTVSDRGLKGSHKAVLMGSAMLLGFLAVTGLPNSARAEDDENSNPSFLQQVMRNLGGVNNSTPDINYRERSPLVVPPKIDLPAPESSQAELAPNWPKDPDVLRRQQASQQTGSLSMEEQAQRLSIDELNKGRVNKRRSAESRRSTSVEDGSRLLSAEELGAKNIFSKAGFGLLGNKDMETAKFTGEPPRTTLIEPPVGYQTPSPNYAYGINTKELPSGGTKEIESNPLTKY